MPRGLNLKRINTEHIIGAVCIAIGIIVLLLTRTFPKGAASSMQLTGPAFFPNLLSIALLGLGLAEIIIGFKADNKNSAYGASRLWQDLKNPKAITILLIIGLLIFYIMFLNKLGFFSTSFIFLFVVLWRMKIVWWKNLLTSFVFLGIIYLIFVEIFTTRLPPGLLF